MAALTLLAAVLAAVPATSSERPSPAAVARLHAAIARVVTDWQVPGMAVAVVVDGEVVLAEGFGVRDIRRPEPVDADTLFSIGSCTKAFTAATIGLLVEDGALGWDEPVVRHLHGFEMPDPSDTGRVTIRDLLGHRTGLAGGDLISWGSSFSRQEIVERIRFLEPASPLRSAFHYDNNTYVAAGELIPAVTGRSWDDVVAARLLAPLGMARTVTEVGRAPAGTDRASPHARLSGSITTLAPMNEENCAAAGAIWSSVADMSRWIRMLLGGGSLDGRRVLAPATVSELWQVQMPIRTDDGPAAMPADLRPRFAGYGLGWFLNDYRGRKLVSHGGESDGMVAQVALIPDEGIGLVVLLNLHSSSAFEPVQYLILDALLGVPNPPDWSRLFLEEERGAAPAEMPDVVGQPPPASLQRYAGRYSNPAVGEADVVLLDGSLDLRLARTPLYGGRLQPLGDGAFLVQRDYPLVDSSPIEFHRTASGEVVSFVLEPDATGWLASVPYRFDRVEATPAAVSR